MDLLLCPALTSGFTPEDYYCRIPYFEKAEDSHMFEGKTAVLEAGKGLGQAMAVALAMQARSLSVLILEI
ncbi:MAG: hypothetical protein ACLUEJ_10210 [Clostridium sp.]